LLLPFRAAWLSFWALGGIEHMENIADILFRRRANNLPTDALADIFGRLVWAMEDNGREICETMCRWIASGDLERARVALAMDEVFLYRSRVEMVAAFDDVCSRFPELRARCDEIIARWDGQFALR
jgi:hypothetical protein